MIEYWAQVFKAPNGEWGVQIYANSDMLAGYNMIDTKDDAQLIGEAFIDGIKHVRGDE